MDEKEYKYRLEYLFNSKNDIDKQIYKLKKEFANQILNIGQKVLYKDTECVFTGDICNDNYSDYNEKIIYYELNAPSKTKESNYLIYKRFSDFKLI